MRPIDFRLNGVSAEWDGTPNASESVIKVNGTELARNLSTDPKADNDPFIWSGWNGEQGNSTIEREFIDVDWSDSGRACLFTRPTVVVDSGDVFLRMPETNLFELGKTYTAVFYVRPLFDGARFAPPLVGRSYSHVYRYPSKTVDVPKGSIQKFVSSFIADEGIINARCYMYSTMRGYFSGCQYEASMGDIYEGPYDPNRPWFSGDSTPEQLMQSPTIGSPLEGSLEDIAGPLVAELTSSGSVDAPLDPLSSRTLVCVTKDRSTMPAYNAFCNNGKTAANGRIDLRTAGSTSTLATRFDAVDGSTNATVTALNKGGTPIVLGVILNQDIANDKSFIRMFDSTRSYDPRYVSFGNGITDQILSKTDYAIWAGLWPKALTEDEIAKVTLWLKQRYL